MKKILTTLILTLLLPASITACGKEVSYADGTYTGRSEVYESEDGSDNGNGYGEVTITIKDGAISDCVYLTYEVDVSLKDENYGMEDGRIANKDFYNKAQKANAACAEYAQMLVQNGRLDGIDAISGATINYNEFVEAVENALAGAVQ